VTTLFEALKPEAQNELIRDHVIQLIYIVIQYPPANDKDSNHAGYCEPFTINSVFLTGEAGATDELAQIREICSHAMDDLQGPQHCAMKQALEEQERNLTIFRNDERCRLFLPHIMAGVYLWELSLVAWMEDDGIISTEIEYWIDESVIDTETCIRVRERMERVNEEMGIIGRVTEP
jgi:hypothetical protein